MINKILGFEVDSYIKELLAPYGPGIFVVSLLTSIVLAIVLFTPSISMLIGMPTRSGGLEITLTYTWVLSLIITGGFILNSRSISVHTIVGYLVGINLIFFLGLIIWSTLLPGQQTCGINTSCGGYNEAIIMSFITLVILYGFKRRMDRYHLSPMSKYVARLKEKNTESTD